MSDMAIGPVPGPCEPWITGEEVADCCSVSAGSDPTIFNDAASAAVGVLFELSARQFSGECERTVRPCRSGCGCWTGWDSDWWPAPWTWGLLPGGGGWGWGWICDTDTCGCQPLSKVKLPGYPVSEILEVTIDGDVVDADTYQLDRRKWLVRVNSPAEPDVQLVWPSCQNMNVPAGEPGTFEISYTTGQDAPEMGKQAAAQLACEIYKACGGDLDCRLPSGVVKIEKQGVTVDLLGFISWSYQSESGRFVGGWRTGLSLVDLFLSTYNPNGLKRRPSFWGPDAQQFARPVPGA